MRFEALQVGELARRTGLTVRALHHYDEIGLLKPSLHTEAGYRLYTANDVARLQHVMSLRQLGFSLDEVRHCLDHDDFSPLEVIRLEALALHLRAAGEVSAGEFIETIEEMTMLEQLQERYFTPEQLQSIKAAREEAGQERLQQGQEAWAELIALVRAEMERGAEPADAKVQALAQRWKDLVNWSTGGDPEIEQAMKRLWEEQGDKLAAQFGAKYDSRPIWEYIRQAIAVSKGSF
jgi:DNA-binding transcriptional MerR regulator